jgi:3-deoxy-D-manno-octulosonic-acid transferase
MENFQEMADLFLQEKAGVQVKNGQALEGALRAILENPMRSAAARRVAESHGGALKEGLRFLHEIIEP